MNALFLSIRSLRSRELRSYSVLALALLTCHAWATDAYWINSGTISSAPQIDASNFINSGNINIRTALPFETSNTRNYTNSGTMSGSPGWFFDDAASNNGPRVPADNFVNLNGGTVQSLDVVGLVSTTPVVGLGVSTTPVSYLWITASNIVNQGTLSVGGGGWLRITGTNVNLARSGLEVTALQPTGGAIVPPTNYINDVGISDVYWGQTNGLVFNSANVFDGKNAVAPRHGVQVGPGGPNQGVSFTVTQAMAFGYSNVTDSINLTLTNKDGSTTNVMFPTNIIKQAVLVGVSDPTIMSVGVRFFPSSTFTNPFQTACVRIAVQSTNVITQAQDQTSVYFYDTLAAETNRGLFVNLNNTAIFPFVYERPANYILSRLDYGGMYGAGTPGNVTPDALYLFDPSTFTNPVANAEYAGYEAFIDNLAAEPPPTTASTVTNFPGRVQVSADTLDFTSTRVRGEGEISLVANHLLSSSGAAVDCQNLSYILGSTNGNLNVANLAKQSVIRMKGNLAAWSALWTNYQTIILENYSVTNTFNTNGMVTGTNAVLSPITNNVGVDLYVLVLNGDNLATKLPVITWDLVTHSTNTLISDSLTLVQNLFLDSQSFTLDGALALSSTTLQNTRGQSVVFSLLNWVYTNAPTLLFFTNNGTLSVPNEAHFGDDRPLPYSDFINTGKLSGGSVNINSTFVANSGSLSASVGPMQLAGNQGVFQNGKTTSQSDLNFSLGSAKFNNHQLNAVGAINFTAPSGLSDAGPTSSNLFRAQNGFNLLVKPAAGDLLGTTFQDQPPNFIEVSHAWAGENRGVSAAGYSNNAAIGQLVLTSPSLLPAQFPLFFFAGTGSQNGLYVDLLDLTSLGTNYLTLLQIDPSLVIYYAAAKLGFTPPPNSAGIPQEPEEYLNGQFGGHLRWVSTFAGPNSSVDVIINGVTVAVNRALRFSKIIDSNGNGIPNFYDPNPFSVNPLLLAAALVQTNQPPSGSIAVSWIAATQKVYQVQFTPDFQHPNWQTLTLYTNTSSTSSNVTIWDTNASAADQRFYRVKTTQ
jgi:hypothetical protein